MTTRLHGLVLALKNGVPAVAIDTVAGGAKVARQADALGWPVLAADSLTASELAEGRSSSSCLIEAAEDVPRVDVALVLLRRTRCRRPA